MLHELKEILIKRMNREPSEDEVQNSLHDPVLVNEFIRNEIQDIKSRLIQLETKKRAGRKPKIIV